MYINPEKGEQIAPLQKPIGAFAKLRISTSASLVISEILLSRLIVVLSISAGIFLRVWQINAMGYNTDEAVYAGQAAAIAGVPSLKDIFPVFRAHPLLFQFLLSVVFKIHFSDFLGRLLAVVVGTCTIFLTYKLGKLMYGRLPGAVAALILALMPYHVVVSRQVLLDGPMVFFATLTLYLLARFARFQNFEWLYAAGAAMGLTFLAKETSIIMVGAVYMFLALTPEVRVRLRDLVIATGLIVLVIAPFPLSLLVAGGSSTGKNYLVWQLFRRPNHDGWFYLETVPPSIGLLVIALAIISLILLWHERNWREKLLLAWIIIPIGFFQIWPVKGFQYLLPIAPAVAVLAGRFFGKVLVNFQELKLPYFNRKWTSVPWVGWVFLGLVIFSLFIASWKRIQPETSSLFLAGTGGVPGGREAGAWIQKNVPVYARLMTIGPSMSNIIQFYGERRSYGLSVSPNPLHRNPSYEPILNPDMQIRRSDLQYIVWDSFSASRSPFFAEKLLSYVNKYNGRAVHTETITVNDSEGNLVSQPVIVIYEVHP